MIIIKDLQLSYGSVKVVENLTLEIKSGTIHGLVGLNGSGKTTLLSSLYCLKTPDSGSLTYNGKPMRRSEIGYLETSNFFYSRITGMEYLQLFTINNSAFSIEGWNKLFELPLNQFIENYSTGMKKKLAFLGIIGLNKPVVILDEPFNGIDMETTQTLKLIIQALRKNSKTIIITSHILESLTGICDAISYLKDKNIQCTFERENFGEIEHHIFGNYNEETSRRINNLLT